MPSLINGASFSLAMTLLWYPFMGFLDYMPVHTYDHPGHDGVKNCVWQPRVGVLICRSGEGRNVDH